MRFSSLIMVVLAISVLAGCAQQTVFDSEPVVEPAKIPAGKDVVDCVKTDVKTIASPMFGEVEYVDILPQGLRLKARIDSGAETTSLGVKDIVEYESDGKTWVRFTVLDQDADEITIFKKALVRKISIKRHGADNVSRHVVEMRLGIGKIAAVVEVTLADREKFTYPVLIGRNFIGGRALIDVGEKYMQVGH